MATTLGDVLKLGVTALVAWWVYEEWFAAPATTTATTTTTPTTTATTAAATTTPIPVTVAPSTTSGADAAYTSLVAGMTAAAPLDKAITISGGIISALPNVFNAYLATVLPNISSQIPAPTVVWPSGDPTIPMTSAQYWSAMSVYLSGHGLMGLGMFGAVGQAYRRAGVRLPVFLLQPRLSENYVKIVS